MPITYSVKKGAEGEEDIIVRAGDTDDIKMSDVQIHMDALAKNQRELTAMAEVEAAKMENVRSLHAIIDTLSDEDKVAVAVYMNAQTRHVQIMAKLSGILASIQEYTGEIAAINEQTGIGFVLKEPVAPVAPTAEAAPPATEAAPAAPIL